MQENVEINTETISLGSLAVPVDLACLAPIQAYTVSVAEMLHFSKKDSGLLELALEEAFSNAVLHFNAVPESDERIHIDFDCEDDSLVISIRDRGIPFEIDEIVHYEASDVSQAAKPGLGMTLMKKCVEKVELLSGGHNGKELRLFKKMPEGIVLPASLQRRNKRRRIARRNIPLDSVIIRTPSVEDLSSLRRLTWRSYGYRYVSQFYDMNRFREMFEDPCYLPAIAVDPDTNEAIFHIALKLETLNNTIAEEGMAFVDPSVRCPGLPMKVSEFLHSIARQKGFLGIHAEAVTSHIHSQKDLESERGTIPCGILMAWGKSGLAPSDLPVAMQSRPSVITHYYVMNQTPATVYIPNQHAKMISEIYEWMNLQRSQGEETVFSIPQTSVVSYTPNVEMNHFRINVKTIGKDCADVIRGHMDRARKNGVEAICVRLALDTPAAPLLVDECEKMGLSFAGILPYSIDGKDAITMQWVGVPMDMDAIKIYGDRGRKLFDYIRKSLGY